MDILYLLVPLSAALVLGVVGVFAWALHSGQFDDLEQHGELALGREGDGLDTRQAPAPHRHEESVGP